MSAALINTKVSEAIDAQEAGDFATALSKLRSAKMLLAAKPDTKFSDEELVWNRDSIDAAIAEIRRAAAAKSGFVQVDAVKHLNQRNCPGTYE